MNVYNRVFLWFLLVIVFPLSIFGFNVCNVDISQPWFVVNDSINNKEVFIVDGQGDIYFEGRDHNLDNVNTQKSFVINKSYFNIITSKFGLVFENQLKVPSGNSLIVRNNLGDDVASFSGNGDIYTKGDVVYQGSNAGCPLDGGYCVGTVFETRDYYCNLTSSKSGACLYNLLASDNCLLKPSTDTDAGVNYLTRGSVVDYSGSCSGSGCLFTTYTDSCSGNILTEYSAVGASYSSNSKNCGDYNTNYCVGNAQVWRTIYGCSSGACFNTGSSILVQSCPVTATSFSSWSCSNINTRRQVITSYQPTCSLGSCGASVVSSVNNNDVSCGTGNYCSGGSCNVITYSWQSSSWGSCSVACGGGVQSRSVWCSRNYDGVVVADSFCGGGKPSLSQACNVGVCSGDITYNVPGTYSWTVPTGIYSLSVEVLAGGGGGGQGNSGNNGWGMGSGGGGGGAGQYQTSSLFVTAGQVLSITVGAGGRGGYYTGSSYTDAGNSGAAGGPSYISGLILSNGGGGGNGGSAGYNSCVSYDSNGVCKSYTYVSASASASLSGSPNGARGGNPSSGGISVGGSGGSSAKGSGGAAGAYSYPGGSGGIGAGGGGGGSSGWNPNDREMPGGYGGNGYVKIAWG